jgi:nitroreductase
MTDRALSPRTAEKLVEIATAAPSTHNSQPWRFVARPAEAVIEIYADPARTLRDGDPHGRAVHIACGAALFNLRLAVAMSGNEPVTRLLPRPHNPLLLACVRLAGHHRARPAERDLYGVIGRRGAHQPSGHHLVPRRVLAELAEAATTEGAALRVLAESDVMRVLRLTAVDHQLRSDPRRTAGLARWPGPPGTQLAVICTRSDDRASWLRAGQAMQHVLLLGAHRGLRASPLTPVLTGAARFDSAFAGEYPEMLLRLGYGPPAELTSRRPVWQTLHVMPAAQAARAAVPARC